MRILRISDSNRKWGNTDILVHHFLRGAEREGAETRFIRLTDFMIQQCRGCLSCIFNDKECVIDDELSELLGLLLKADCFSDGKGNHTRSVDGCDIENALDVERNGIQWLTYAPDIQAMMEQFRASPEQLTKSQRQRNIEFYQ